MRRTFFAPPATGLSAALDQADEASVNSDCSGRLQLGKGKNAYHWGLAISSGGNQVCVMEIDSGSNVSGTAAK